MECLLINGVLNIKDTENIFIYCIKIRTVMAVYMKAIPTLRGEVADRFIKMSEDNLKRRASVDFSREAANSYAILNKKKSVRK